MEALTIPYGKKVRDKLTGVEGVVTAYGYYYGHEANVYRIEYMTKENHALCRDWVEEDRLEVIKEP